MSKHHKRIVLDFDDTLAFTTNRDFKNAKPNVDLIKKTNRLYDEGWQIDIFTARGSISCETRKEAKHKYEFEMEQWLLEHGVKYNLLSFEKPLAAYYVDDKGISPDDFLNIEIQNLEGGLSGADIYTDGRLVHKTDKRAHDVVEWFKVVRYKHVSVPQVERVVGETITMKYVEHDKNFFKNNPLRALALIQETLDKFKKIKYEGSSRKFTTGYMERIRQHIEECEIEQDVLWALVWEELQNIFWPEESFGHGDFGITNMLFNGNHHLTLIDPIPEVFGCTELDIAKFIASLYINKYDKELIDIALRTLCTYNKLRVEDINILVRCELTRVIKYHPNKEFIIGLIQDVY
jgi:capsule biosynthesis phosphatase